MAPETPVGKRSQFDFNLDAPGERRKTLELPSGLGVEYDEPEMNAIQKFSAMVWCVITQHQTVSNDFNTQFISQKLHKNIFAQIAVKKAYSALTGDQEWLLRQGFLITKSMFAQSQDVSYVPSSQVDSQCNPMGYTKYQHWWKESKNVMRVSIPLRQDQHERCTTIQYAPGCITCRRC